MKQNAGTEGKEKLKRKVLTHHLQKVLANFLHKHQDCDWGDDEIGAGHWERAYREAIAAM